MTQTVGAMAELGAQLRAARQQRGLALDVLATQLKVSPARLQALEDGRWHELPDGERGAYARGLAKTLCRLLGVDAQAWFPAPVDTAALGTLERVGHGLNERFEDERGTRGAWRLGAVAAVLLLAAAAVLALWPEVLPTGLSFAGRTPASAPAPEGAATVPPPIDAPAAALAVASAPSAPSAPASAQAASSTAAVPAASAGSAASPSPAPLPGGGASLRLQVIEPSWVSLTDALGHVHLSRLMTAGEELALDVPAPARLVLGNAPGTRLQWRGQTQDLSAHARQRVARLELP